MEEKMGFAKFMSTSAGRALRVVAGLALILVGFMVVGGLWGTVIAVVGLVPFLAGIFDVCVIGKLFMGTPFKGADVRAKINE
jgi:hypothetical protein